MRSRELGEGPRQVMQKAGLTGEQAARLLDVSPSFVSMLLSGKRTPARWTRGVSRGVPGQGPGVGPAAGAVPGAGHPGLVPAARFPAAQAACHADRLREQGGDH
ncbi:MAG TPA: helix-turn-helix transcriptional regulator [Pseudonocardiaceae bacterium]|nr:helix-turn-helix transcriptional regulator [Pseudonocardiaceae bacterium]